MLTTDKTDRQSHEYEYESRFPLSWAPIFSTSARCIYFNEERIGRNSSISPQDLNSHVPRCCTVALGTLSYFVSFMSPISAHWSSTPRTSTSLRGSEIEFRIPAVSSKERMCA
ncbi:uncharacterized protein PHALS_08789 [Plasmopara halstedii]|uniref:Uncharacterized protein n=1 Tax=Plasmopara halstedii TaxID=4781 RepID=A0A0P1ACV0_PLAHL|nr:uncharacterized protein PHALS_08789 [Plasmopara halstedii]CEG38732.1 hypothetical protein PHALS_08789 [Plasmopara halstedii]|eukprot:XP_024575101.1 hypothetical protein PHALS_08789 [Plasmopara halstedii]